MSLRRNVSAFWIGALLFSSIFCQTHGENAPSFSLPKWGGGETVRLEDFAGKIVVLDFFAYWCVPCQKLSASLETEVQEYYRTQNGNAHGLPVQVCSINVEREQPERTAEFIRKTGISLVLDDTAGIFDRYGGSSLPLILIVDGSAPGEGFRIVHRHIGAEGTSELRQIIDGIGGGKKESGRIRGPEASVSVRRLRASFEGQWSSDISLTDSSFEYGQSGGGTEFELSLSEATMGVNYRPSAGDIISQAATLSKNRMSLQGSLRQLIGDRFGLVAGAGWYSGYTDYRSLWLNEYYRQLYETLDGYKEARPAGYNFSGGIRWEYLPATAFLQVEGIYGFDTVSPGYEIGPFEPLRRGAESLTTSGVRLSLENVLSRRLRVLNEIQAATTTDREWRFGYQGSINWAISEHWVARGVFGATREAPRLNAGSAAVTIERDWKERWFCSLFTRFYHDTGQIENPLIISTATPGLDSFQAGLGFRRQGERTSLQLLISPYFSRYAPVTRGSEPFARLYRNRDWISFQSRFEFRF